MTRTREDIDLDIAAISEAIRMGAKRTVFHSGGTRREVEYHSLSDMLRARSGFYAEVAQLYGRSPIILAAF